MLSCEVCKTFKNTILKNNWKRLLLEVYKNYSLKLCIIHRTKAASDTFSVKKVFLVVDRAVKVTCFYIDQLFLVRNKFQGTKNNKLPLLRNIKCLSKFRKTMTLNCFSFVYYSWKSILLQNVLKCAEG